MANSNWAPIQTTNVVPACADADENTRSMARKWLICAVAMLVALVLSCVWITAYAYGDNSDGSGNDSNSSNSGVTITDNITDTENLLGSHAAEVTDAIAKTEQETGVHVHLLYLSSFNSDQTPQKWASTVLESTNPKPNTVLLAVASNDGNLVVAVSSNSDEWLKSQETVDKLSAAAQEPLMKSTPDWPGSATSMMEQIVQSKKTSTSSSSVTIGVIVMIVVLVVLLIVVALMLIIRVRSKGKKPRRANRQALSRDEKKARKARIAQRKAQRKARQAAGEKAETADENEESGSESNIESLDEERDNE
ncbi:TPM domain-containing protein [Bifidobacterium felsineum]|nr:TPM domain-containing protein [Bifidobacterium felsineum]MBT1163819.1 TPM domain-containing protein [Bifidobacterium felsineum]